MVSAKVPLRWGGKAYETKSEIAGEAILLAVGWNEKGGARR